MDLWPRYKGGTAEVPKEDVIEGLSNIIQGVSGVEEMDEDRQQMVYFPETVLYDGISGELMKFGKYYQYVSNTFVNAFLNVRGDFLRAYVFPDDDRDSKKFQSQVNEYNKSRHYNVDFKQWFDFDIVILKRSVAGEYWVFDLCQDVSDCCLGRFKTDDTVADVVAEFKKVYKKTGVELNIEYFNGWVSFG